MAESKDAAGNLQVGAIDVAMVQSDIPIDSYLLRGAAAHSIVGAFDNRGTGSLYASETYGAIFCIVFNLPYACSCFQQGLITISIELGNKNHQQMRTGSVHMLRIQYGLPRRRCQRQRRRGCLYCFHGD